MARTIRLFDQDSHLYSFEARVLGCCPLDHQRFSVVLDQTAFFPEGGGQYADVGTLNDLQVLDVQETRDGVIQHIVSQPFEVGAVVVGQLDGAVRFRRMQNHTGEHILSGLFFAHFGFQNVGFHLGHDDVTMDIDGVLDRAQLDEIEAEANRAVTACLPVRAFYPSSDELACMTFRCKDSLLDVGETDHTGGIRIVEIEGYDRCACCAPHVTNTGEIGLIKILDFIHYKGGTRIHILCGFDALADYQWRYKAIRSMANTLSLKQGELVEGFEKSLKELEGAYRAISDLRQKLWQQKLELLPADNEYLCLFDESADTMRLAQKVVTKTAQSCRLWCALFVGNDADGYRYTIGRGHGFSDVRTITPSLNQALQGRGGGSADMIQGQIVASREQIESFMARMATADTI